MQLGGSNFSCVFQCASAIPEETEAPVWDEAGDELSILTRDKWLLWVSPKWRRPNAVDDMVL